jgi:hypothetical protein
MDMSVVLLLTMGFLASVVMTGLSEALTIVMARRRIKK